MATISPILSLTTSVTGIRLTAGGDVWIDFQLLDTAGTVRGFKTYVVKADGTGIYDTSNGAMIAATTPVGFMTAVTTIKTNIDTALTAAAAASKLVF